MSAYLLQLGEKIRAVRSRRGLTLQQLGKQCSLSARFVANVELGRGNISVTGLHAIACALDMPIESLAADGQPFSGFRPIDGISKEAAAKIARRS